MRVGFTRKSWLILWMLILASTAGCFQSAGGALESTDAAQLLMTYTPVITDTPIPTATFESPSPFPSLTPTPDANALEVIIVSPTFDLAGTQVADASLQDDVSLTSTAVYLTSVAPLLQPDLPTQAIEPPLIEQQIEDPLLLSATAVVREATQTAEAGPTLTALAQQGITATSPVIVQSPIPGATAIPGTDCIHEVRVGDRNLYRIGLAYGVTYQAIAQASGILNPNLIYIGQRLTIPGCGTTGQQPPATSTPSAGGATSVPGGPGSGQTYIVQQGDTLFALSLRWGVLVNQIAAINGISNINLIFIGQQLTIP